MKIKNKISEKLLWNFDQNALKLILNIKKTDSLS